MPNRLQVFGPIYLSACSIRLRVELEQRNASLAMSLRMTSVSLCACLDRLGWSNTELAFRAEVFPVIAQRWVSGKQPIPDHVARRVAAMAALAEALGRSPAPMEIATCPLGSGSPTGELIRQAEHEPPWGRRTRGAIGDSPAWKSSRRQKTVRLH